MSKEPEINRLPVVSTTSIAAAFPNLLLPVSVKPANVGVALSSNCWSKFVIFCATVWLISVPPIEIEFAPTSTLPKEPVETADPLTPPPTNVVLLEDNWPFHDPLTFTRVKLRINSALVPKEPEIETAVKDLISAAFAPVSYTHLRAHET